jgi:hypothetical protein
MGRPEDINIRLLPLGFGCVRQVLLCHGELETSRPCYDEKDADGLSGGIMGYCLDIYVLRNYTISPIICPIPVYSTWPQLRNKAALICGLL